MHRIFPVPDLHVLFQWLRRILSTSGVLDFRGTICIHNDYRPTHDRMQRAMVGIQPGRQLRYFKHAIRPDGTGIEGAGAGSPASVMRNGVMRGGGILPPDRVAGRHRGGDRGEIWRPGFHLNPERCRHGTHPGGAQDRHRCKHTQHESFHDFISFLHSIFFGFRRRVATTDGHTYIDSIQPVQTACQIFTVFCFAIRIDREERRNSLLSFTCFQLT